MKFFKLTLLGNITSVYENQLVTYCSQLKLRPWLREADLIRSSSCRMTVLHLAAALGYSLLINTLIKWRFVYFCLARG